MFPRKFLRAGKRGEKGEMSTHEIASLRTAGRRKK
jgi:hypothetical protein